MMDVDYWECPECGHRENASDPHIPERMYEDEEGESMHFCSNCIQNGRGEKDMNGVPE